MSKEKSLKEKVFPKAHRIADLNLKIYNVKQDLKKLQDADKLKIKNKKKKELSPSKKIKQLIQDASKGDKDAHKLLMKIKGIVSGKKDKLKIKKKDKK